MASLCPAMGFLHKLHCTATTTVSPEPKVVLQRTKFAQPTASTVLSVPRCRSLHHQRPASLSAPITSHQHRARARNHHHRSARVAAQSAAKESHQTRAQAAAAPLHNHICRFHPLPAPFNITAPPSIKSWRRSFTVSLC
ncbi:hypothetical protein M0R45_034988 [Rubus argutus]|uniref:Uncharacterized protein n=1 Tax=Rubus argutus TaxID=59490 RepID=A0AAW1VRS7_RUBAR